jgi:hypothetical protein
MINQNSNNKPSGFQSVDCDSGLPVSGRTAANGNYQILKVNPDGTLNTTSQTVAPAQYLQFANPITVPTGALAANTYVAQVQLGGFDSGIYRINPAFIFNGTTTGGINFVIYNSLGSMFTYVNGLIQGAAFAPTIANVTPNGGVAGYWHNTAVQSFGTVIEASYNRNNTLDVFLDTDTYYIAIITDGAVNITTNSALFGCIEASKIGS